ncbi:tripartite motif-containing protein 60-like isoform X2 [Lethenteron reissneri]|uniref:tripartite motif-containing protein 60-like isoform X2 n=1 Tax=Lethenteron reissneri TaxID=7753 RepID=UPI002AB77752|nr:tripartite motif-containing protein 60-like isoform X2 [Lethenteron reissneri]
MQPKQVAAMGLISGIILFTFISMGGEASLSSRLGYKRSAFQEESLTEVKHNECEDKGQYRSVKGFCCHLCPAGNKWLDDCISDDGQSFCKSCMPGKSYMDVANRDPQCKKCSTCNILYEDVQRYCTVTCDTVCQCKDGYSRPHPLQPCGVTSNTEKNIAIPTGIGTFTLLVAVVALLIYRKKKCLYPFGANLWSQCRKAPTDALGDGVTETVPLLHLKVPKDVLKKPRMLIKKRMKSNDGEVWRQFHELLPEVYKSISENTFYFLYEMDKKYNIHISVYWNVYEITDISARASYLLNYFIRAGEKECQGLLEMILAGQNKQMQLQTLLDFAVKCSPTLNRNTAHKELNISEDGKTVEWLESPPDKPDHPDRFKCWSQVLSSETFSGGCFFWVVNVGDVENLRVGVSYQSILRKEQDSACLMGFNSRSWCLWKRKNKYKAWHDQHSTELEVGEHPRRIGVGLDYEKRVLLFYNADNNEHLHTFYAHFSEPLHVALWVWHGFLTIEPVNND